MITADKDPAKNFGSDTLRILLSLECKGYRIHMSEMFTNGNVPLLSDGDADRLGKVVDDLPHHGSLLLTQYFWLFTIAISTRIIK